MKILKNIFEFIKSANFSKRTELRLHLTHLILVCFLIKELFPLNAFVTHHACYENFVVVTQKGFLIPCQFVEEKIENLFRSGFNWLSIVMSFKMKV